MFNTCYPLLKFSPVLELQHACSWACSQARTLSFSPSSAGNTSQFLENTYKLKHCHQMKWFSKNKPKQIHFSKYSLKGHIKLNVSKSLCHCNRNQSRCCSQLYGWKRRKKPDPFQQKILQCTTKSSFTHYTEINII